jgi:hypothetical protein
MAWTDMEAVGVDGRRLHPRYLRLMYHGYRRFPTSEDLFSARHELTQAGNPITFFSGVIYSQMVLGSLVHTSTVLVKRDWVRRVGLFREDFRRAGEDFDFHLRVCLLGPVVFVDAVTIRYQIGAADAITRPELAFDIANAYLVTAREALVNHADRITIPRKTLTMALSSASAWAGRTALAAGLGPEARSRYMESLRLNPFSGASWKFLAVALLPRPVRSGLFRLVKFAKTWAGVAASLALQAPEYAPLLVVA